MRTVESKQPSRRVRPLLLVLLWVWAGVVFLVVDLFMNVSEFDEIRPRASLYRGMRVAAHRMVGEPYRGEPAAPLPRSATRAKPNRVGGTEEESVRFCRNAGRQSIARLRRMALHAKSPLVAGHAMRALGRLGAVAGDRDLVELCRDPRLRVRQETVIAFGASREPKMVPRLEQVLAEREGAVRPLAVQSLGQIGGETAKRCIETVLRDPESSKVERLLARTILARERNGVSGGATRGDREDPAGR